MDFACRGKLRGLSSSPASFPHLLANASQPQLIFIEHREDNSLSPPHYPYLQSSLIVVYPPKRSLCCSIAKFPPISTIFLHFPSRNPVSQATLTDLPESISIKLDIREAISLVAPGKRSLILDFSVDRSLNFETGETYVECERYSR